MAKVRIDWGDLEMALDSGDGMMSWFLDRETGEVIGLSEIDEVDEEREIWERINADEDARYLGIPSMSSHDGFRIMEDFARSVDEPRVRDELFDALDRRRPFRSFKDALLAHPEVREQWFEYHDGRLREYALDWLRLEGIDAELVPYIGPSGEAADDADSG